MAAEILRKNASHLTTGGRRLTCVNLHDNMRPLLLQPTTSLQGICKEVRRRWHLVRAPTHRRHGGTGAEVLGVFRLGMQELRRRRTVRHCGTGWVVG